ncbi:hypothetical protein K402DRAFT_413153 [Aulographum hederae CBS 113979]|uniref:Uncharacterized protein n=1 Tax=Aulographum hederae CBS 113979 TaxID=1176131 RepID=A0A6G1GXK5_9PEZI|nr:hypothetical protein K402DRAFT_413153 [Aulographum hederae CBS 113979]
MFLVQQLRRCFSRRTNRSPPKPSAVDDSEPYIGVPSDYPEFPPPPPEALLKDAGEYWRTVQIRKFVAPCGESADTPLFALYRLYEAFVLDKRFAYRDMLEQFWRKPAWKVCEIPDPEDSDPSRYAFLAGVTYLIVESFNARVALGLTRGARPLMSMEEAEEAKRVPHEKRPYEEVPPWAERAPALEIPLSIPTESGELLCDPNDKRASPGMLRKNIIMWTPHIHFT